MRYTELRELDESSFAFDGGLAFVVKRPVTIDQALMLTGGVEFRFGDAEEELEGEFQSEFLSVRASLSVPVTDQTAIAISFVHPLIGDEASADTHRNRRLEAVAPVAAAGQVIG